MKCVVIVVVFLGSALRSSWANEYMEMCPCLPVNMCRGVFRASPEDEMYFSRVLQCDDEMHKRCCNFSVTVGTDSPKEETEATTESLTDMTTEHEDDATEDMMDERFDQEDGTTEMTTLESRENLEGVLVIYPTQMSGNASERLLRAFEGDSPENELFLVYPQESSRETRATTSEEDTSTTPEIPKNVKKYRYNNATRRRFMPILKINETETSDVKPIFKVTNSDNRRFLEELYRNRTRFGVPASQITTNATPTDAQKETTSDDMTSRKPTPRPTLPPKKNLFYDPTRRKSFLKKVPKETDGASVNLVQNPSIKQAVDINHREMIQEVLSELKKESDNLAVSKDIKMDPTMVARIGKIQKRLIDKIVDKMESKMERKTEVFDDIEEITATTKREQIRPFRGALRYADTLRAAQQPTRPQRPQRDNEPRKRKNKRRKQPVANELEVEFVGDTTLPIGFRPSPLWTVQRGGDPFPVPQVTPTQPTRESRDIIREPQVWRKDQGFVPIPQIARTTPIEIIGPIPKGFTHSRSKHTTSAPSELPSEQAPPNFRRFTGKVISRK